MKTSFKIKLVSLSLLLIAIYIHAYSQNNYFFNIDRYYNVKDTINYDDKWETDVPKIEVVDNQIIDSLSHYIHEIESQGSRNLDENGMYIGLYFSYNYEDSTTISFVIGAACNYYMLCDIDDDTFNFRNFHFAGNESLYYYLLGCFMFKDYLVCVITRRFVVEQEWSQFFKISNDNIRLNLYENHEFRRIYNRRLPHKEFVRPMVNPQNYVEPE